MCTYLSAFSSSRGLAAAQLFNSVLSCISCVYLAYILIYILDDFCIVCVSTYIINSVILVCSVCKLVAISNLAAVKRQKNASKKAS